MSTLELEHIKHTSSSSNNLSTHSDGSLTVGNLQSLNVLGNVGIGTSSPSASHRLTLDKTSNYGGISLNQNGNQVGQIIQEGGTGNIYVDADSNNVGGGLIFRTAGGTTRMTIDTLGRATMPNQPYFYATGTATGTLLSTVACPYNQTSSNIGSHYNTSNYTFTAPVDGRYLFTFSVLNYPSAASNGEMYFSVNGGGYTALSRFNNIASQQSITGSAILNLSTNDTVKVIGSLYFYTAAGHGHFSGMLLG